MRETTRPDPIELTISPTISGSAAKPDAVGLKSCTNWNQRGRKMMAPKKAKLAKKVETIEVE